MNAPLPHHATSNCAIADDPLGLTHIFDPEIQLAQWRRPTEPLVVDWLAAHASDLGSGLRQMLTPGQQPDLGRLPAGMRINRVHVRSPEIRRKVAMLTRGHRLFLEEQHMVLDEQRQQL